MNIICFHLPQYILCLLQHNWFQTVAHEMTGYFNDKVRGNMTSFNEKVTGNITSIRSWGYFQHLLYPRKSWISCDSIDSKTTVYDIPLLERKGHHQEKINSRAKDNGYLKSLRIDQFVACCAKEPLIWRLPPHIPTDKYKHRTDQVMESDGPP